MIKNEDDLVRYLVGQCKQIERLENSAKGGTPDTMIPCMSGWHWFELKVVHANELIFQNTQLAFFVKNRRLPKYLWAHVIAAKHMTDTALLLNCDEVLALPKRPYAKGKTAVRLPDDVEYMGLRLLVDKIGVYIDL
jgi:hypothetical protein